MNKIYNNGCNRRETNQILQIERSKLGRLLEQERRLRLALVETAGKQLAANPDFHADREQIWLRIQSHSQIQTVQNQISVLTDTYPQFLNQANAARAKSEREARRELDAANRPKPKTNEWADEFARVFGKSAVFA